MWGSVLVFSVFIRLTLENGYNYNADVLEILTQVVDRAQREETGVRDVLCIDCQGRWSEDLFASFQKQHRFIPVKMFNSSYVGLLPTEQSRSIYGASLVFVSCVYNGQCSRRQLELSPSSNKYAIYFQLFINSSTAMLDRALWDAKKYGIVKVVQLVGNIGAARTQVRCGGAFLPSALELPVNEVLDVLFNGTLTNFDQFSYSVAIAPLRTNAFAFSRYISGFEVDMFHIIVRHQRAKYVFEFVKLNQLSVILHSLHEGRMDVILNNLDTNHHLNIERAIWQEHRSYCIMIPKRFDRAHLQLLLHPFQWNIWMVLIGVLLSLQLLNLLFPRKFTFNFVMMCFFGSGPSENKLATSERLLLCSVSVIIFLLTETYQAILLSLITADPYVKNPQTVDEFLERNISLYVISGYKRLVPPKVLPVAQIVDATTLHSTFLHATVQPCSDVYFWNANPLGFKLPLAGEMIPLEPPLFYTQHAVTFSRFSPATRFYQTVMDRLFETGVYQCLQRKWFPDKIYREKDATFNDTIVLTEDLVPVWELFAICVVVSTLMFFCEWIHFYFMSRFNTQVLK